MNDTDFHLISDLWSDSAVSVTSIILQDKLGRVVSQLRDDFDGLGGRGKWGMFGGHVEAGETPAQAAIRELAEETNINAEATDIAPFVRLVPVQGYQVRHYIYTLNRSIELHEILVHEGAGFAALNARQLAKFDLIPSARMIFDHMNNLGQLAQ